jgi:hypothetical protein
MEHLIERPPYIEFEQRAQERRSATGEIEYYTVNFVVVTPHGSRDRFEKNAEEWLANCDLQVSAGRMNKEWVRQFRGAYNEWKLTGEIPITGTPLSNWPVLTAGELKSCLRCNLRSVEDLAAANEEVINRIGMGARSLKQRAVDWIESQKGTGGLVSQLDAMRQSLAATSARLEVLERENQALKASVRQSGVYGPVPLGVQEPVEMPMMAGLADESKLVDDSIDAALR